MKILVTGGAGFIGNHLALKLDELGHDVIINDFSHNIRDTHLQKFDVYDFDLSEYEHFKEFPKVDYLHYHGFFIGNNHLITDEDLEKLEGLVSEYLRVL